MGLTWLGCHNPAMRIFLVSFVAVLLAVTLAAQTPGFTSLHSFTGHDGGDPVGKLVVGSDGSLYGVTFRGGSVGSANGVVFQLTPSTSGWTESTIYSFDTTLPSDYYEPSGLVIGNGGSMYVSVGGGGPGRGGAILQLAPPASPGDAWTATPVHNFPRNEGTPWGVPIVLPNGRIYGVLEGGQVYILKPPASPGGHWSESSFSAFGVAMDDTGVISRGGSLYAVTGYPNGGPPGGCGAVYQATPPVDSGATWTVTAIYTFAGAPTDGCTSYGSLAADSKGNLYGVTAYGGSGTGCKDQFTWMPGCGTVFELQPPAAPGGSWTERVLYNFTGTDGDGAYPFGGLAVSPNGTLYGTTNAGGNVPAMTAGYGTVFQLTPPGSSGGAWTENVLHRFNGTDGSVPAQALTLATGPVLYGTTLQGGVSNDGTVFMVVP
jgi:hypothetical protein